MSKVISRKKFFHHSGKYLVGAAAGVAGWNALSSQESLVKAESPSWPWQYVKLDPESASKSGHDGFYKSGCCYAGFAGIVEGLREKVGEPFTSFPMQMMGYGGGGVKGWGTLCGALNGACAAINLVSDNRTASRIINELMTWYTQTPLPSEASNRFAANKEFQVNRISKALPLSVSGSSLCHISTTKWCNKAEYPINSGERFERCARLSGDVAAKAVELLNANAVDQFQSRYSLLKSTNDCLSCHGSGKSEENVAAKLRCVQCHGDPHK